MLFSKQLLQGVFREMRIAPAQIKDIFVGAKSIAPTAKYHYGQQQQQYVCYFHPEKIDPTKPVLVFFHGGCWMIGKPEMFTNRARIFVEAGYPVFMPTHRKIPHFWYGDIKEDLISIFQRLPEWMATHNLQDRPIVIGGMSSGGNLAALATYDDNILDTAGFPIEKIIGSLFCAAPLNLEGMPDSIILRAFAGKKSLNAFRLASPINHLKATHHKPMMIVHGGNDGLVEYDSVVAFKNKAAEITKSPIKFVTIPKGAHISAVKWVGPDLQIRHMILDWLANISEKGRGSSE